MGPKSSSSSMVQKVRNHNGFTLLEMTTVLCILGIVMAITGPILSKWYNLFLLNSAARQVQMDILETRDQTVKERRHYGLTFYSNDRSYEIFSLDDGRKRVRVLPEGIQIKLTTLPIYSERPNTLVFALDGRSGRPPMGGTVMLTSDTNQQRFIIVSRNGRVRIDTVLPSGGVDS
ncbi:prepilin-type N-terminal cleavage/methylation domain-containing protein [Heliobacterium chlorum]|uniref:Prepilin-type N-terminal cleavage/methylation domain-containing protein n=1 Tax=Heliobacterium chlorum TaxID=2698 RepID=A0ABR7T3L2_HELCL|nr:GspH/FimT family pseudopilin [Heliobacterium chlorum]MBC9784920.1 prepilin-type N-terminal cleavage/methylation domain-containing protein [Heliobacterium chlorum]